MHNGHLPEPNMDADRPRLLTRTTPKYRALAIVWPRRYLRRTVWQPCARLLPGVLQIGLTLLAIRVLPAWLAKVF